MRHKWRLRYKLVFAFILLVILVWVHLYLIPSFTDQYHSDCYLPSSSKENLEFLLRTIIKSFEKHQVVYWLDYGSLLGAVRYHGIIPWDGDGDISYVKDDPNIIKALNEIMTNNPGLSANTMIASFKGLTVDFMRWEQDGDLYKKYYPAWVQDNVIAKMSHKLETFPVSMIGQRKRLKFLGIEAAVPEQYEILIKLRYRLTHWFSVPFKWKCYAPCFIKNDKSCES